jgi:hypothetical protein
MGFMNWLTGQGHPAKGEGGIKLINEGRAGASVRIVGTHASTPPVPAFQERVVRLPAGRYAVRFAFEDGFETFQVDSITVVPGMATPVTLTVRACPGQKMRMVSGPV